MSLVLSTETILKKIEKHRYKYAKIFEGFVTPNDDDNKHHFERFDCKSAEELTDEISEFAKMYHGKFTIVMRVHNGGTDKTLTACRWNTIPEAKAVEQNNSVAVQGQVLTLEHVTKLKQEWLQEMSLQLKLKELETIVKMKDSELDGFKTQGDKLAYVGLQMLSGLGFGKKLQTMNGGGTNLNGTGDNVQQPEQVPIQDVEGFKAAINKIHWLLGEETLIKLAKKIKPGDDIIGMVKMYANS